MRRIITISYLLGLLCLMTATAAATTLSLPATRCGESEREDGAPPCGQDPAFTAGTASSAVNLQVGGTAYGCDAEWASSFEFDISGVPAGETLLSATLVVHKTGYADDAQGFPYVGAYTYEATGSAVDVPRADLTPQTALDILYPPSANVDLSFDVTGAMQDLVDDASALAGFLLSGVYSEAGYENRIYVGGASSAYAPRLIVVYNEPVGDAFSSWSSVKALYR